MDAVTLRHIKVYVLYYAPEYAFRFGLLFAIGGAVAAGIYLVKKRVNAPFVRMLCTVAAILVQGVMTLRDYMGDAHLFWATTLFKVSLQTIFIAYYLPMLLVLAVQILQLVLRKKRGEPPVSDLPQTGNAAVFAVGAMLLGISAMLPDPRTTFDIQLLTALHQNPVRYILCGAIPLVLGLAALILARIAAGQLTESRLLGMESSNAELLPDESRRFHAAKTCTAIAAFLALYASLSHFIMLFILA